MTPTPYFRDSPAWTKDPATEGYIKTCQGTKPGDPINPVYADRIKTAALISEAIEAYDAGRYQQALDRYTQVLQHARGRSVAHVQRYLSCQLEARPTHRGDPVLQQDRGLRSRQQTPGGAIPVQARIDGVPAQPPGIRTLSVVVEADRDARRQQQRLPRNRRAYQSHRPGAHQPAAVAAAGRNTSSSDWIPRLRNSANAPSPPARVPARTWWVRVRTTFPTPSTVGSVSKSSTVLPAAPRLGLEGLGSHQA